MIRNELHILCSPATKSISDSQCLSDLSDFTWKKLIGKLEIHAPVLLTILKDATVTRNEKPNREAIIGMCVVLLLKHRYYKMSLVQKILALSGGFRGGAVGAVSTPPLKCINLYQLMANCLCIYM